MRKKMKMRAGGAVKKYAEGGRVSNEPVGARMGRARQAVNEFFTATGERPAAGGAYSGMTYEQELEEAVRSRRDLEARRGARRAATPSRPSLITNNPVGNNNAANAGATQRERVAAAAAGIPAGAVASAEPERAVTAGGRVGPGEDSPEATVQRDNARTRAAATRPARGAARARPRTRSREMSADDLNDMSLALIRRGNMGPNRAGAESNIARAMGYKKGGKVAAKGKK
jgi:hypothetical protein